MVEVSGENLKGMGIVEGFGRVDGEVVVIGFIR